jgi:hypothetical protein
MVLPWLSLPFVGGRTFRRFLPAVIFISFIVKIENYIGNRRRWWRFHTQVHPKIQGITSLIVGPFFVITLWFMKWTYGKFFLFLIINVALHFLYAYPGMNLLSRLGIVSYVRMKPLPFTFMLTTRSLLLYWFQYLKEKYFTLDRMKKFLKKEKEEDKTIWEPKL